MSNVGVKLWNRLREDLGMQQHICVFKTNKIRHIQCFGVEKEMIIRNSKR